jgi:hypothetical protein
VYTVPETVNPPTIILVKDYSAYTLAIPVGLKPLFVSVGLLSHDPAGLEPIAVVMQS